MDKKQRIMNYYQELDRSYFMEEHKDQAHMDSPFPIGHGQTISQPSLVLKMTLLLDLEKDSKVLEIGTGSGYQTALLAKAAGMIYTVERIEALHLTAKERLGKAGYENIKFKLDNGVLGWKENAPYDRIMVTAGARRLPDELIKQLAPSGKMIIPVGPREVQDLMLISKDAKGEVHEQVIAKVRFVELVDRD